MNTIQELNTLPVPTYRWLKLNHLPLEVRLGEVLPYTKDYMKHLPTDIDSEIILRKMNGPMLFPNNIATSLREVISYGVSEDMVELSEKNYNSGLFAYLPVGKSITQPLHVQYTMDKANAQVLDYNIIYADTNSSVTLIYDYTTLDDTPAFHNGAMRIYAKEGANVTIIKLQRMNSLSEHYDSGVAIVSPHAKVNLIQVELGGRISVTNYISKLQEAGEATIDSVYFGDGNQLLDMSYLMEHQGRRSISNILTKGALKDHATKTFRGTLDFKRGASQSDGSEKEYVILFDKTVKSNAIPLLLCAEDDVKGQHAASAGKVDPEKLYYMMSRGFNKEEAMKLIVEASFRPLIDKIPLEALREGVGEEIHRRLVHENI